MSTGVVVFSLRKKKILSKYLRMFCLSTQDMCKSQLCAMLVQCSLHIIHLKHADYVPHDVLPFTVSFMMHDNKNTGIVHNLMKPFLHGMRGHMRRANAFFMGHSDSAWLVTGPGNRRWTVGSPSTPKKTSSPRRVCSGIHLLDK